MANFSDERHARTEVGAVGSSGFGAYVRSLFDASLSWEHLRWLVQFSELPVGRSSSVPLTFTFIFRAFLGLNLGTPFNKKRFLKFRFFLFDLEQIKYQKSLIEIFLNKKSDSIGKNLSVSNIEFFSTKIFLVF